jgi:hypothetical protein
VAVAAVKPEGRGEGAALIDEQWRCESTVV